ncbi:MAG: hypothetical protein ABIQ06_12490 [Caldimonas sp.]
MTMNTSRFLQARRGLLLISLAMLALPGAGAAELARPTVAVLSLIGDEMSIVVRRMTTGSRLDRNDRQSVPIEDPAFDVAAAAAAAAKPAAERIRVSVRYKRLFAATMRVLSASNGTES